MQKQQTLRELIKENVVINDTEHLDFILSSFVSVNGKKCYIDRETNSIFVFNQSGYFILIQKMIKRHCNVELDKEEVAYLAEVLSTMNCFNEIVQKLNPLLLDKDKITVDTVERVITVHTNSIIKDIELEAKDYPTLELFMKEYLELFPQLRQLISAIVWARVAPAKKSFWYIVAPSNWGKSFLMVALEKAGLAIEIRNVDRFLANTEASSVSVDKLARSACLIFDEFESFGNELKNVTFSIRLAEKFKMSQTVDVGLKIMFGANKVNSLSDGIDEQILNRVMFLEMDTLMRVTDLPTFKKVGSAKAITLLSFYITQLAKKEVDNLKRVEDGVLEAEQNLYTLGKQFDIRKNSDVATLHSSFNSMLLDAIEDNPFKDKEVIEVDYDKGIYFIRRPKKTIRRLLDKVLDKEEIEQYLSYYNKYISSSNVICYMKNPKKINGKSMKGKLITLK